MLHSTQMNWISCFWNCLHDFTLGNLVCFLNQISWFVKLIQHRSWDLERLWSIDIWSKRFATTKSCTVWMITVGIIFQNKCTRLGFHETFNQNIKEIFCFKERNAKLKRWNVWGYFVLSFFRSDVFLSHVVNGRSFIKLIFQTVGVTLLLSFGCSLYIDVTSETQRYSVTNYPILFPKTFFEFVYLQKYWKL